MSARLKTAKRPLAQIGLGLGVEFDAPPANEKLMRRLELSGTLDAIVRLMDQAGVPEPRKKIFEFTKRPWCEEITALCKLLCDHGAATSQISSILRAMDRLLEQSWDVWDEASLFNPRHEEHHRRLTLGNRVWILNPGEIRLEKSPGLSTVIWSKAEGFL